MATMHLRICRAADANKCLRANGRGPLIWMPVALDYPQGYDLAGKVAPARRQTPTRLHRTGRDRRERDSRRARPSPSTKGANRTGNLGVCLRQLIAYDNTKKTRSGRTASG